MTYNEFIDNILNTRGRFVEDKNIFKERHHIKMKSVGGDNSENNLIDLIGYEHYQAHKLLALDNPDCKEAQIAWWMMCHMKDANNREYEVTQEDWLEARKRNHEAISGENSSWYGRRHSEETKKKISKANKGKKPSEETRLKLIEAQKNRPPQSEETRRKRSISMTGKKKSLESRKKMSESHSKLIGEKSPRYGTKLSEESKVKIGRKNGRKVFCEGMIFYSVPDCANYYNINFNTLKNWLYGRNKIPKIWEDRKLRFLDQIEHNEFQEQN